MTAGSTVEVHHLLEGPEGLSKPTTAMSSGIRRPWLS
jgi:hypothetical protein